MQHLGGGEGSHLTLPTTQPGLSQQGQEWGWREGLEGGTRRTRGKVCGCPLGASRGTSKAVLLEELWATGKFLPAWSLPPGREDKPEALAVGRG